MVVDHASANASTIRWETLGLIINFWFVSGGWSLVGASCLAPAGYGGACERAQSFVGSTDAEKSKFAIDCKAPVRRTYF